MNIDVAGKSGHNYPNKYNSQTKTIEWFGKTNSHSQQPTFQKILNKEIIPHFFARWDNRQREYLYLGIGKEFNLNEESVHKRRKKFRTDTGEIDIFALSKYKKKED